MRYAPSLVPTYFARAGAIIEQCPDGERRLSAEQARWRCARYRHQAIEFETSAPEFAAFCRDRFTRLHAALTDLRADRGAA